MPTKDSILNALGKIEGVTAQEISEARDYFSGVDAATKHFTGSETLEISELRSQTADIDSPSAAYGLVSNINQTILAATPTILEWRSTESSGEITIASNLTDLLIIPSVIGETWAFSVRIGDNVGVTTLDLFLKFYDAGDSLKSTVEIFRDVTARSIVTAFLYTIPSFLSPITYMQLSMTSDLEIDPLYISFDWFKVR
jgi:hypothetical protein